MNLIFLSYITSRDCYYLGEHRNAIAGAVDNPTVVYAHNDADNDRIVLPPSSYRCAIAGDCDAITVGADLSSRYSAGIVLSTPCTAICALDWIGDGNTSIALSPDCVYLAPDYFNGNQSIIRLDGVMHDFSPADYSKILNYQAVNCGNADYLSGYRNANLPDAIMIRRAMRYVIQGKNDK